MFDQLTTVVGRLNPAEHSEGFQRVLSEAVMVYPAGVQDRLHSHSITLCSPVFGGFVLEYGVFVRVEKNDQCVDIFMYNSLILWREVNAVLRCVILEWWIVWASEWTVIMETSYEGFHSFIFFFFVFSFFF